MDERGGTKLVLPPEAARRYRSVELLGAGGMGEVWRVHDGRLGRDVALKTIRPSYGAKPGAARRFEREVRALAALDHPHLVRLFDVGRDGDFCWYTMELLEGRPLSACIDEIAEDEERFVGHVAALADVLAAAHEAGLVHRDLKPENVFLGSDGVIRLMDFGLVKFLETETVTALTRTGEAVGTLRWLAPEWFVGGRAGPPSDVWQLGALAYRGLTGRHPLDGADAEAVFDGSAFRRIPPAGRHRPGLAPALGALLDRAMAFSPAERPTMAAFRDGLRGAFEGQAPAPVDGDPTVALPRRSARRGPRRDGGVPMGGKAPASGAKARRVAPASLVACGAGVLLLAVLLHLGPCAAPPPPLVVETEAGATGARFLWTSREAARASWTLLREGRALTRGQEATATTSHVLRLNGLEPEGRYRLVLQDGDREGESSFTCLPVALTRGVWTAARDGAFVATLEATVEEGLELRLAWEGGERRVPVRNGRALVESLPRKLDLMMRWTLFWRDRTLARGVRAMSPDPVPALSDVYSPRRRGRLRRGSECRPLVAGDMLFVAEAGGLLVAFRLSREGMGEEAIEGGGRRNVRRSWLYFPPGLEGPDGKASPHLGSLLRLVDGRLFASVARADGRLELVCLDPDARERLWRDRYGTGPVRRIPAGLREDGAWARPVAPREWSVATEIPGFAMGRAVEEGGSVHLAVQRHRGMDRMPEISLVTVNLADGRVAGERRWSPPDGLEGQLWEGVDGPHGHLGRWWIVLTERPARSDPGLRDTRWRWLLSAPRNGTGPLRLEGRVAAPGPSGQLFADDAAGEVALFGWDGLHFWNGRGERHAWVLGEERPSALAWPTYGSGAFRRAGRWWGLVFVPASDAGGELGLSSRMTLYHARISDWNGERVRIWEPQVFDEHATSRLPFVMDLLSWREAVLGLTRHGVFAFRPEGGELGAWSLTGQDRMGVGAEGTVALVDGDGGLVVFPVELLLRGGSRRPGGSLPLLRRP